MPKIGIFLIVICLLCGVFLLFLGIKDGLESYSLTQNYDETQGYFTDYTFYSSDDGHTTYRLIYTYTVYGQTYSVATDYGSEILPAQNSIRTVKYDPFEPQNAVIAGGSSYSALLLVGAMFTFVPLVFIAVLLPAKGRVKSLMQNFLEYGIGLFFVFIGFGTIWMATGSINPLKIFESFHPALLIPLLMIAVGALVFFKTLARKLRAKRLPPLE